MSQNNLASHLLSSHEVKITDAQLLTSISSKFLSSGPFLQETCNYAEGNSFPLRFMGTSKPTNTTKCLENFDFDETGHTLFDMI